MNHESATPLADCTDRQLALWNARLRQAFYLKARTAYKEIIAMPLRSARSQIAPMPCRSRSLHVAQPGRLGSARPCADPSIFCQISGTSRWSCPARRRAAGEAFKLAVLPGRMLRVARALWRMDDKWRMEDGGMGDGRG